MYNLNDIAPYLLLAAPLLGGLLDFALREEHKIKAFDKITSVAQIGERPFSLAFFGLMVVVSIYFTFLIISLNGMFQMISGNSDNAIIGVKSAAPIVLAIAAKIIIWDYLLALKSFFIFQSLRSSLWKVRREVRVINLGSLTFAGLVIAVDLYFTALITSVFLRMGEAFQSEHVTAPTNDVVSPTVHQVISFFDMFNIVAKESIEYSF